MASRFASVNEEQTLSINEGAVPKITKMLTKRESRGEISTFYNPTGTS